MGRKKLLLSFKKNRITVQEKALFYLHSHSHMNREKYCEYPVYEFIKNMTFNKKKLMDYNCPSFLVFVQHRKRTNMCKIILNRFKGEN